MNELTAVHARALISLDKIHRVNSKEQKQRQVAMKQGLVQELAKCRADFLFLTANVPQQKTIEPPLPRVALLSDPSVKHEQERLLRYGLSTHSSDPDLRLPLSRQNSQGSLHPSPPKGRNSGPNSPHTPTTSQSKGSGRLSPEAMRRLQLATQPYSPHNRSRTRTGTHTPSPQSARSYNVRGRMANTTTRFKSTNPRGSNDGGSRPWTSHGPSHSPSSALAHSLSGQTLSNPQPNFTHTSKIYNSTTSSASVPTTPSNQSSRFRPHTARIAQTAQKYNKSYKTSYQNQSIDLNNFSQTIPLNHQTFSPWN